MILLWNYPSRFFGNYQDILRYKYHSEGFITRADFTVKLFFSEGVPGENQDENQDEGSHRVYLSEGTILPAFIL